MNEPEKRVCLGCGIELDNYCFACQGTMLSEAFAKAHAERNKNAKRYKLVLSPLEEGPKP